MERIILEMDHVFGKRGRFRLNDIHFSLPAGYIMGLAGPNGAGKTTCLKMIMAGKKSYDGNIYIDGEQHYQNGMSFLNKIGYVSEDNVFFEDGTIKQNVELLSTFYQSFDLQIFKTAMEKMELTQSKVYGKMSRGERMKFQMAFAMAHKPCLYLLDEVTAGMDPVFRLDFFKILYEVIETEEASVLMTSHIATEIEQKMDFVGIIKEGHMVQFGTSQEVEICGQK